MTIASRLPRMWHTVRYLRPVQIYGRAWHRLHRPRVQHAPAPALAACDGRWQACARKPSMLGAHRFRFLNDERELAGNDWNSDALPKLWLYNLHYFDDLNADGALSRTHWHRELIARWIADNPPASGNGWEPYCLSLRIVNWIKWRSSAQSFGDDSRERSALNSLATQVRYLRGRLERHLLGNHLWANYKALLFAGAFFQGAEAGRWRDEGLAGLRREIDEQILDDGGHFERSPMYHAILLEDVLDMVQLARLFPEALPHTDVALWRAKATAMLGWLQVMTHPDGGIAFFNDTALGIAPNLAQLQAYARSLGIEPPEPSDEPLQLLPQSGYARLQCGDAVVIADVGEIGPDYLPGHAHADTLSFELSLRGRRVLVNAGTSRYDISAERLWQRGTAAHNTIEIDGRDSSEVWSSFRVARRAKPLNIEHGRFGEGAWLAAAHDGYRRLKGRPTHHRRWVLQPGALRIEDRIEGGFERAVARYRVHPDIRIEDHVLQLDDTFGLRWRVEPASERVVASTYHPEFGLTRACQVIEATLDPAVASAESMFLWDC
ncbi:MAG: heparinase II/III family protein [Lysobacter sp.]